MERKNKQTNTEGIWKIQFVEIKQHTFKNKNCIYFQYAAYAYIYIYLGFPGGSVSKEPTCNAGDARDMGQITRLERSPRGGHSNPLQYSCLENPMDRGAWQATVKKLQEWDMTEVTEHSTAYVCVCVCVCV